MNKPHYFIYPLQMYVFTFSILESNVTGKIKNTICPYRLIILAQIWFQYYFLFKKIFNIFSCKHLMDSFKIVLQFAGPCLLHSKHFTAKSALRFLNCQ
jgi:hypothetical protein